MSVGVYLEGFSGKKFFYLVFVDRCLLAGDFVFLRGYLQN